MKAHYTGAQVLLNPALFRARGAIALAWFLTVAVLAGCELVTGGYQVEAGSGGNSSGGGASSGGGGTGGLADACMGLPILRRWDFEGADALDQLNPVGDVGLAGGAVAGLLAIDYSGQTPGKGGRAFTLPVGTARASFCTRTRWSDILPGQSTLIGAIEFLWPDNTYCGFFLGVTDQGLAHLFGVDPNGIPSDEQQGAQVLPVNAWYDAELRVDVIDGEVRGRVGDQELTLDWVGGGFDQCVSAPGNGVLTLGGDLLMPSAVVLQYDDLAVGQRSD